MRSLNFFENLADHGDLGGHIFKAHRFNSNFKHASLGFGGAALMFAKFFPISLMVGPTLTYAAIAASTFYGVSSIDTRPTITTISEIDQGEYRGKLRLNAGGKNIIVDARDAFAIVSGDENGANVLRINHFIDEASGEKKE